VRNMRATSRYIRRRAANVRRLALGAVRSRWSGAREFGKRAVIVGKVRFRLAGAASFGDRFIADGDISPIHILVAESGTLAVGSDVYMNAGVSIEVYHCVQVGDHVLMAPFVSIIDDSRHEAEPGTPTRKGPVTVGNNVWLGRNVAVMPGVTIGDGSVIGANSVVTRDIPPSCFAAGSPAQVIRKLELPEGWVRR
jgi:acetyltransferase-like isoleucine patch superfamily enzyme